MKNARKNIGKISMEETAAQAIISLAAKPIPCQRNHGGKTAKKRYLNGPVRGGSQTFVAVYIVELRKLFLVDGYHRSEALSTGQAMVVEGYPLYLQTFTVETMNDAEKLYDSFNSLAAAKRANDYFDSGLREVGQLNKITGNLMGGAGKVTAAQLASGFTGSVNTKRAAVAVIDGMLLVDKLGLKRTHEIAGMKGVYVAAAQHCKEEALVVQFIRSVNGASYETSNTNSSREIAIFRDWYFNETAKTGGKANSEVFSDGLAAFVNFRNAAMKRRNAGRALSLSLAEFKELMSK